LSIAVLINVHDGLVLAADSASSLIVSPGVSGVAKVYNNANKIFNLYKGKPLGCVAYGAGSIGNASMATLIKDLRARLMSGKDAKFDPDQHTMESVANTLGTFLESECTNNPATAGAPPIDIGILVGGYSTDENLGEVWSVEIRNGKMVPPVLMRTKDLPGISWGGVGEVLQRIVFGFSLGLFDVLAEVNNPGQGQVSATQLASELGPLLQARLQAAIVFAPMPIQDAIDLAEFLVHSAIMFSRFNPGAQVVGGPIEIAAITKHEGFKWIKRKHYYDEKLNPKFYQC
jgi:hypothetical protein